MASHTERRQPPLCKSGHKPWTSLAESDKSMYTCLLSGTANNEKTLFIDDFRGSRPRLTKTLTRRLDRRVQHEQGELFQRRKSRCGALR